MLSSEIQADAECENNRGADKSMSENSGAAREIFIGASGTIVGAVIVGIAGGIFNWFDIVVDIDVPPDAVLAFDSPECPPNWIDVGKTDSVRFAGRTFVAAGPAVSAKQRGDSGGTDVRIYGDESSGSGGSETLTLREDNIPLHDHASGSYKFVLSMNGGGTAHDTDNSRDEANLQSAKPLKGFGSSSPAPLDNMSPYVVMTYCKKVTK